MSMFTLAISCLTTSNLPWFMYLTFLLPMKYCSLQHWTILPSPVTSTASCCFCFGTISSFFLELFLCFFLVAFWEPTDLESSSFSVMSSLLFHSFMGFPRQEYVNVLSFPSPVDYVLSDLSTMTHPPWVAIHGMTHSFIELDKVLVHVKILILFCDCGFHSVCPLSDKDKRLLEASWWGILTVGETEVPHLDGNHKGRVERCSLIFFWKNSKIIILKKDNAKRMPNYCTFEIISHADKVMFKILQTSL